MINIWATWCAPCIAELPLMPQIEAHYSGKLKVYTILYFREGEGSSNIPAAVGIANGIPGFNLPVIGYDYFRDKPDSMYNAFSKYLTPATLPTTIFVNRSGKVVAVVKGSHNLEQWIDEIDKLL
jgi:thiol-disulfide isomerase/thioredoxin